MEKKSSYVFLAVAVFLTILVQYALWQLIGRLRAAPDWSQGAWLMHYLLLPLIAVVSMWLAKKYSSGLKYSNVFIWLIVILQISTCTSFFTLVAVGRVYLSAWQ